MQPAGARVEHDAGDAGLYGAKEMKTLFEVKEVDRRYYRERLEALLPARLIDMHTHVWLEKFRGVPGEGLSRCVTWPWLVARENPIEHLVATYRLMFPGKCVIPLVFGNSLSAGDDMEAGNAYVGDMARDAGFPALLFATPRWTGGELEERILAGGFLGVKVYLSLSPSYLPENEIRIFDFLPPHQLEVLNRHGWLVMLHIPRAGRLKDPVNLAQLLEIEARYPDVRMIVAHVGRAYCQEDAGNAFEVLRGTERMCFDISANTNAEVFAKLIEAVGPGRILFGSDLPITRMRMRRICENGSYVNLVPDGLYGDVTGDRHMRGVGGMEAETLSYFLYEEIAAFLAAARATGLKRGDIEDVFHNNACRLLAAAGWKDGE